MAFGSKKKKTQRFEKKLGITDTTLRDGHQSVLATRMRLEDMLPILEDLDNIGFRSLEVWGGATFDVCTRFLGEDPWERLAKIKEKCKKTPLQMLLRGQNLVGYRNYADDVVRAFVHMAATTGIDVFRVFDALNDERNFIVPFEAIKKEGKHAQGTICYSQTEGRMGGDIFNLKYYIRKVKAIEKMGADSICIKDMAGLMLPYDTFEIIKAIKEATNLPVQLHTHYTCGLGSMTYLKAIEAGVDALDCSLAPFALRTGQPAIEPLVASLMGTPNDLGLDLAALEKIGRQIETIAPKYLDFLDNTRLSVIDISALRHQTPGGMLSNLVSQLREANALDKIEEVFEEIPKTRKDLGFPPLVTPTSQIVGSQAVQNVLFGRYELISSQVKDYFYGLYGEPPAEVNKKIAQIALKDYPKGQKPVTCRPGDVIEPELEEAKSATEGLAKGLGDELIYALYPTTGLRFLKWKYGIEKKPDELQPMSLETAKKRMELVRKALAGELIEKYPTGAPQKSPNLRTFNVFVAGEYYQVEVDEKGMQIAARNIASMSTPPATPPAAIAPATPPAPAAVPKKDTPASAPSPAPAPSPSPAPQPRPNGPASAGSTHGEGEFSVNAPMPGLVVRYEAKKGQKVKKGDIVVVLEAMKMQNALPSPVEGVVKSLGVKEGSSVMKNDTLVVITAGTGE
jgi:pyruvate carboxylase subunit B